VATSPSLALACMLGAVALTAGAWPLQADQSKVPSSLDHLTKDQRRDAIQHAEVWSRTDIPSMDLRAGPQSKGAFAPFSTVTCNYVDKKSPGASAKFYCAVTPGDEVKVKYGRENVEVYAEVAATRLLWALGFGADRMYPVRVVCRGCPADPHTDASHKLDEVTFEDAAIERKMPGKTMETRSDEGWSWAEFDSLDAEAGATQRVHRDALKLLAVLLQHTDSRPRQQRLICLAGESGVETDGVCGEPLMMINDLGLTFGRANLLNRNRLSGVNFERWSDVRVWKDPKGCVGKLSGSATGTLTDPTISEAGRKFLADLLLQLSDAQLHDMFEVARFGQRGDASIDQWVAAFKHKRDEIVGVTCPS
jgi:hypothetical protein